MKHNPMTVFLALISVAVICASCGPTSEKSDVVVTVSRETGETFDKRVVIDIPYFSQETVLPNGCEAVSAAMVLNYWGYQIKPTEFVDSYLLCETLDTEYPGGLIIGPDPGEMYAGDPRNEDDGLGCYSPVIVEALCRATDGRLSITDTTGTELSELKKNIDKGIPVIVWATIDMERVTDYYEILIYDREGTYLYPENEHCLVLIGYDEENYIFADPYESRGVVSYPVHDCEMAFSDLGKQSVVVRPLNEE